MTASELRATAHSDSAPPSELSDELRALWLAAADRWHEAHDLCQDLPDPAGAWIHAYLHRVEGDLGNAGYWYHRAGRQAPPAGVSLDQEWDTLATEFGS